MRSTRIAQRLIAEPSLLWWKYGDRSSQTLDGAATAALVCPLYKPRSNAISVLAEAKGDIDILQEAHRLAVQIMTTRIFLSSLRARKVRECTSSMLRRVSAWMLRTFWELLWDGSVAVEDATVN